MNHRHRLTLDSFSLIELLTVVAILALLIALLVPALNASRARTRRVECGGNLRQTGLAIAMFAQDNPIRVPYTNLPVNVSNRSLAQLSPYVPTPRIFRCPSDQGSLARAVTNYLAFMTVTNACSYSLSPSNKWGSVFTDSPIVFDRVGFGTNVANRFVLLEPANGIKGAVWKAGNHRRAGGNILFGDGRTTFHTELPQDLKAGHPTLYSAPAPVSVQNPL